MGIRFDSICSKGKKKRFQTNLKAKFWYPGTFWIGTHTHTHIYKSTAFFPYFRWLILLSSSSSQYPVK